MLCTADCNKAKAQGVERLQVRLRRRCNKNAGHPEPGAFDIKLVGVHLDGFRDAQAVIAASYRSVETPCA